MNEPAPDDREGWAVYADWLKTQGDERRVDIAVWAHRRRTRRCPYDDDGSDLVPVHLLYPRRCPTCFPSCERTDRLR